MLGLILAYLYTCMCILFILFFDLFKDVVSGSDYVALINRMTMKDESQRIC